MISEHSRHIDLVVPIAGVYSVSPHEGPLDPAVSEAEFVVGPPSISDPLKKTVVIWNALLAGAETQLPHTKPVRFTGKSLLDAPRANQGIQHKMSDGTLSTYLITLTHKRAKRRDSPVSMDDFNQLLKLWGQTVGLRPENIDEEADRFTQHVDEFPASEENLAITSRTATIEAALMQEGALTPEAWLNTMRTKLGVKTSNRSLLDRARTLFHR